MLLRKVGLEQQLSIDVLLVHAVVLVTVVGIQQVHRCIAHHGDVRAVLRIEEKGVLHVTLVTVGLNANMIQVVCGGRLFTIHLPLYMGLPAFALFLHHADAAMKHVGVGLVFPAVLEVPLAHVGLILETIVVLVVMTPFILIVGQNLRAQTVVDVYVGVGIRLKAAHRVAKEVYRHALVVIGLQVLDVNLSGDTLVAVAD